METQIKMPLHQRQAMMHAFTVLVDYFEEEIKIMDRLTFMGVNLCEQDSPEFDFIICKDGEHPFGITAEYEFSTGKVHLSAFTFRENGEKVYNKNIDAVLADKDAAWIMPQFSHMLMSQTLDAAQEYWVDNDTRLYANDGNWFASDGDILSATIIWTLWGDSEGQDTAPWDFVGGITALDDDGNPVTYWMLCINTDADKELCVKIEIETKTVTLILSLDGDNTVFYDTLQDVLDDDDNYISFEE